MPYQLVATKFNCQPYFLEYVNALILFALYSPLAQPDASQRHHEPEGGPSHECGHDLQVLGFGHIPEGEGAHHHHKDGQGDPVGINSGQLLSWPADLRVWDVEARGSVGRLVGAGHVSHWLGHGRAINGQVPVQVDCDT